MQFKRDFLFLQFQKRKLGKLSREISRFIYENIASYGILNGLMGQKTPTFMSRGAISSFSPAMEQL
jgi:hypothetical protein